MKEKRTCKVISVVCQKRGSGKSASATQLAVGLVRRKHKVLLIDADPQGTGSMMLGVSEPDELNETVTTVLAKIINEEPVSDTEAIIQTEEGVDLLPANVDLASMEATLMNTMNRERSLRYYLSSRVKKLTVYRYQASDATSFREAWNKMPKDQAVVMIDCHANPNLLAPGMIDAYQIGQNKLADKNIKVIILIGCNAGHREHYDPNDGKQWKQNIAEAFAKKFKCVVYAADGNVQAFTLKCGKGDDKDYWGMYNSKNSTRKTPEGWFAYDGSAGDGYVRSYRLHKVNGTTIGELLDVYYAAQYSW